MKAIELPMHHSSIYKWQLQIMWTHALDTLWQNIWVPYRAPKDNAFLWQIVLRVIATNGWRFVGDSLIHQEMMLVHGVFVLISGQTKTSFIIFKNAQMLQIFDHG